METQKSIHFVPLKTNLLTQQIGPVCWMCPFQRHDQQGDLRFSIIFGECVTWISDEPCEWIISNPDEYLKALNRVITSCNQTLKGED